MPFINVSHINKIYSSLLKKNYLVHALKYKKRIGNPIGFNILVLNKLKKIKGDTGAKYIVKQLKKNTNFIKVTSKKIFKDLDRDCSDKMKEDRVSKKDVEKNYYIEMRYLGQSHEIEVPIQIKIDKTTNFN